MKKVRLFWFVNKILRQIEVLTGFDKNEFRKLPDKVREFRKTT